MKRVLILMLLLTIAFAFYGPARYVVEKRWIIEGGGNHIEMDGLFIVNNSYHHVLEINASPELELIHLDSGAITVRYNGTFEGKKELSAVAVVDVEYDTSIPSDSPLEMRQLEQTNLTDATPEMIEQAKRLADEQSTLGTIRNITEWINDYLMYDYSYIEREENAKTVFKDRRGVCMGYAHLLIAFSRSVGLNTRYVSGYVKTEDWQPHAWVEIELPGYGWIPVDPTLGEIVMFDNSHIAMFYGKDQADIAEVIWSDDYAKLKSDVKIKTLWSKKLEKPTVTYSYAFDENEYKITIWLNNTRNEFVFIPYVFILPEEFKANEQEIILLKPNEERMFVHQLDREMFKRGYVYTIPMVVQVGDFELRHSFTVSPQKETEEKAAEEVCAPIFILIPLFIGVLVCSRCI